MRVETRWGCLDYGHLMIICNKLKDMGSLAQKCKYSTCGREPLIETMHKTMLEVRQDLYSHFELSALQTPNT